jgi:hypothetical protein
MAEASARLCKICKKVHQAFYDGLRNDQKTRIWVDENNRQWNGKVCPNCQVAQTKTNMRKLRSKRKEVELD